MLTTGRNFPVLVSDVWSSEGWLSHLHDLARQLDFQSLYRFGIGHAPLAPLAAMIAAKLSAKETVRILDLGGSIGENLIDTVSSLSLDLRKRMQWVVCDSAPSMEIGRAAWQGRHFAPDFVDYGSLGSLGHFDICLLCGTLQYMGNTGSIIDNIIRSYMNKDAPLYIRRNPFNVASDSNTVIRQFMYPAYGRFSNKYI